MPQSPCYKPIHIKPASRAMDTASNPDEIPVGGYRLVQNWEVDPNGRMCRMPGFQKLLSSDSYNNEDYHDQSPYTRQHITTLFQAVTPANFTKLFLGTQNRIAAKNDDTGNWKVISDQLGGAPESGCQNGRWYAANNGEIVVLTNNVDPVQYHIVDQASSPSSSQAVSPIPDLETLRISRASVVIAWNNFTFLMNVVQDGVRLANRIVWSDYKHPISFIPQSGVSLAGKFDLEQGEAIINAMELQDVLLVYTTKRIWQIAIAGGENVLSFGKRYTPKEEPANCLAYRNTLVSDGVNHWFWGADLIYQYSMYQLEPRPVDAVNKAAARIFDSINTLKPAIHVGGFHSAKKSIYWSWAKEGEDCPSETFVMNTADPFWSFLDHGFTAFCTYRADSHIGLRRFILENCICSLEELGLYGGGFVKEGGFCRAEEVIPCPNKPMSFYSQTPLVMDDVTTENYEGEPDADSLFTLLGNSSLGEICGAEVTQAEGISKVVFLGVSAEDQCIKQFTQVYNREIRVGLQTECDPSIAYVKRGYRPRLLSGAIDLGAPDDDKEIVRLALEVHTVLAVKPSQIELKVGVAAQALDPLSASGKCAIMWETEDKKKLECLSDRTAAQHALDGTRPSDEMEWGLYQTGRYFYFDLTIVNDDVNPKDTGSPVCLSRITFDAAIRPRC